MTCKWTLNMKLKSPYTRDELRYARVACMQGIAPRCDEHKANESHNWDKWAGCGGDPAIGLYTSDVSRGHCLIQSIIERIATRRHGRCGLPLSGWRLKGLKGWLLL